MEFICTKCSARADVSTRSPRCACGGLWDVDFTPPDFGLDGIDRTEWSIFRYRRFMALAGEYWRDVTLGEGMTPIIKYSDGLLLKMDYFMPTLSFKDRGGAVLAAHCRAIGVDKVVQDSSGNAGNSVAAYCGRAGIECEIFVPEGTSPKKIDMIRAHGARVVVVPGGRDNCADVCRDKVEKEGVYYANHVYNPFFYEGTKTYIYEVYEQLGRMPSTLFIPVGNGTLLIGVVYGLEHLLRSGVIADMPHIVALQSEGCDPILRAAEAGREIPVDINPVPTEAEGIAVGKPMRGGKILALARKHGIEFIHAPEAGILLAREELAKRGIYCEHTTAASYAAYLHYCRLYGRPEDALLTMCGAGLKSDH